MNPRALRLGLGIAAAALALDQIVKTMVVAYFGGVPGGIEITSFFNFVMVWNRGVSFGILGGVAPPPWLLAAVAGGVAIGLAIWLARVAERRLAVGIGLLIGGALGNVADRLRFGAVADFLDFHWGARHWPAFNLADVAITLGVAVLIIDSLLNRPEKPN